MILIALQSTAGRYLGHKIESIMPENKDTLYLFSLVVLSAISLIIYEIFIADYLIDEFASLSYISFFGSIPAFIYIIKAKTISQRHLKMLRQEILNITFIIIANMTAFVLMLFTISTVNALFVTVIYQLQPLLHIMLGKVYIGDTVKNWPAFFIAFLLSVIGILIFSFYTSIDNIYTQIGLYELIMLVSIILTVSSSLIQTKLTRKIKNYNTGIPTQNIEFLSLTSRAIICFVISHFLSFSTVKTLYPTEWKTWAALLFLGIVPVCLGSIIRQNIVNRVGIPTVEAIQSMRPIIVQFIMIIIALLFTRRSTQSHSFAFLGIILTMVSIFIVFRFARPITPKNIVDHNQDIINHEK